MEIRRITVCPVHDVRTYLDFLTKTAGDPCELTHTCLCVYRIKHQGVIVLAPYRLFRVRTCISLSRSLALFRSLSLSLSLLMYIYIVSMYVYMSVYGVYMWCVYVYQCTI